MQNMWQAQLQQQVQLLEAENMDMVQQLAMTEQAMQALKEHTYPVMATEVERLRKELDVLRGRKMSPRHVTLLGHLLLILQLGCYTTCLEVFA